VLDKPKLTYGPTFIYLYEYHETNALTLRSDNGVMQSPPAEYIDPSSPESRLNRLYELTSSSTHQRCHHLSGLLGSGLDYGTGPIHA